jgi:branched-chain amino acid transport system permease protein
MIIVQAALSGLLVGGLFAIMAVGLSVTWGMLRVINLAHFAFILVGAYLTYAITTATGLNPLATILLTGPALFVAGAFLHWLFVRSRVSEFGSLLASFGVLIVAIQLTSNVWSADFRRLDASVNPFATQSVALGPIVFPTPTLLAFVAALVVTAAGVLFFDRTYPGRALRAFAQDPPIAAAFGINHLGLGILLAGLSGATAALAGMLVAIGTALTPTTAFEWFGTVFAVVILGGVGSVTGALLAGMSIGALSAVVSVVWSPATAPLAIFGAIVAALVFRPKGLFGEGLR